MSTPRRRVDSEPQRSRDQGCDLVRGDALETRQKGPGRVAYGFTMTFMGENFRRMWNFGDS